VGAGASKNEATGGVFGRGYAAYRSETTLNSCRLIAVYYSILTTALNCQFPEITCFGR
jgi:hypothetical protein